MGGMAGSGRQIAGGNGMVPSGRMVEPASARRVRG
jgi:hypothetical protein